MDDRRPPPRYQGRLELTWTNKDQALLWSEDGSYRWLPPSDYRVAEVRLLHDAGEVGEVGPASRRAADNLLIRGDALNALTSLARIPEFQREYLGKVKLAYLDPPFNTQQAFEQYDDALEHSVWLTMMRDRLLQIKRLLSDEGSVWVHLDDSEVAYCRVVMDEIFGRDNFVASVIWEKTDSPRMDADYFSGRHDTILVFRKSDKFTISRLESEGGVPQHYNRVDAEGRSYYTKPLRAMGGQGSTRKARPSLYFALRAPDGTEVWPKLPDGQDGAWRWNPAKIERDGHLIEWVRGRNGWAPYFRIYADPDTKRPPETIWFNTEVGSTRTSAREIKALMGGTSFATPKPEALLGRIVALASNPGDIVLDCFLGSGTTAAVAHKTARRWLGVERSVETLANFAIPRMEKVVAGADLGGITEAVAWEGGGGFRILEVAPSMFVETGEYVVLADWAVNGHLAEATAAQLGFEFRYDPPFCGVKGRSVLAVIDGLVTVEVVDLIAGRLEETERSVICGTAIAEGADAALKAISPGSRVRRIPASILADYRRSTPRLIRVPKVEVEPNGSVPSAEPVRP